jgi:hypothetical protein
MSDEIRDKRDSADDSPAESQAATTPSTGGAKLFVIFFLTLVPLLGIAIVAMVLYRLLVR